MKTLIGISFLVLASWQFSFGQISLRVFNYRPSGEFGFAMKPLVSAEIGYQPRFSKRPTKRMRTGFSILYLNMKPRMEVFPVYATGDDGKGNSVFPGAQSFQRYMVIQLIGGVDYAFYHKEKINVFGGFDIVAGAASVDYTSIISGWKDESYQGGGYLGGFRFRLGAEYSLSDHFGLVLTANKSVYLISEPASINWANDFGLGVRYSFN